MQLGSERTLRVDVHSDVQHVRLVECSIGVWHGGRIAVQHRDSVRESHPRAQNSSRLYVLRRQVDTRHATSITLRGESTCAADPATHIKDLVIRHKTELIEKTLRRSASPNVELLDRCKIFDPDTARCLAEFGNARNDRLEKAVMGVM